MIIVRLQKKRYSIKIEAPEDLTKIRLFLHNSTLRFKRLYKITNEQGLTRIEQRIVSIRVLTSTMCGIEKLVVVGISGSKKLKQSLCINTNFEWWRKLNTRELAYLQDKITETFHFCYLHPGLTILGFVSGGAISVNKTWQYSFKNQNLKAHLKRVLSGTNKFRIYFHPVLSNLHSMLEEKSTHLEPFTGTYEALRPILSREEALWQWYQKIVTRAYVEKKVQKQWLQLLERIPLGSYQFYFVNKTASSEHYNELINKIDLCVDPEKELNKIHYISASYWIGYKEKIIGIRYY